MSLKGKFFRIEISYDEDHRYQSSRFAKDSGYGWDYEEVKFSTYTRRVKIQEYFVSPEDLKKAKEQREKYNEVCRTARRYFSQELPFFPNRVKMELVPGDFMDEILGKSEFHPIIKTINSGGPFKDTSDNGIYYTKLHFGIRGMYIAEVSTTSEIEVVEHSRYEKYGYEHAYLQGEVSPEVNEFIQKEFMCENFEKQFSNSWDMRYMPTPESENPKEDESFDSKDKEPDREITLEDIKKLQDKLSR